MVYRCADGGKFYGIFGIDFYLDVLTDILGESYSEQGYAFLVDRNGNIIEHPNSEYEFSDADSVNIHDLVYDKLYSETGMVVLKDYDGKYKVCASMDEHVSNLRIIVVKDWWSIYGNVLQYAVLFLGLFGGCILAVNVVINKMIQWQSKANDNLKEAEGKMTNIDASYQKEDIKNYEVLVHALKSSSKLLGAVILSDIAKDAETAAKNQDISYIRENHAGLIDKYRETVQCIIDVLDPAEAAPPEEDSAAGTEVSKDELLERLSEFKESLDTFETDKAEIILAEMSGFVYQGTSVRELLRDVRQDMEDFELGAAAEKVGAIIDTAKE